MGMSVKNTKRSSKSQQNYLVSRTHFFEHFWFSKFVHTLHLVLIQIQKVFQSKELEYHSHPLAAWVQRIIARAVFKSGFELSDGLIDISWI